MTNSNRFGGVDVRWIWGKLSAVLVFLGIYLISFNQTVQENSALEAVVGIGLLVGTIGLVTYLWKVYL